MRGRSDPEKHRRRSIRLPDYDYSQAGAYFVTICTHNRTCLFGAIVDREMRPEPTSLPSAPTTGRACSALLSIER